MNFVLVQVVKKFCPFFVSQNGITAMLANGYFEFLTHFVDLEDPREDRGHNHLLIDMVGLVLCGHNLRGEHLGRHRTLLQSLSGMVRTVPRTASRRTFSRHACSRVSPCGELGAIQLFQPTVQRGCRSAGTDRSPPLPITTTPRRPLIKPFATATTTEFEVKLASRFRPCR